MVIYEIVDVVYSNVPPLIGLDLLEKYEMVVENSRRVMKVRFVGHKIPLSFYKIWTLVHLVAYRVQYSVCMLQAMRSTQELFHTVALTNYSIPLNYRDTKKIPPNNNYSSRHQK